MNASPRTNGPLVTFALYAYNRERLFRDAVQGAVTRTYQALEIVPSDDFSDDGTFQIMQEKAEKYAGPHTTRLNRNPRNLGLVWHANKLFELATGDIIVAAAGDDISSPFRAERTVRKFAESTPLLVHSQADEIDIDGSQAGKLQPDDRLLQSLTIEEAAVSRSLYLGASATWAKELHVAYGPLQYGNAYEDLALGFRAIIENRFASIREPLLQNRVGDGPITHRLVYKTLLALWRRRKKAMSVMFDVLCQRQDDYGRASNREAAIEKIIAAEVEDLPIRKGFYEGPKSIPKLVIKKHYSAIKILLHETAALTKYVLLGNAKKLWQSYRGNKN